MMRDIEYRDAVAEMLSDTGRDIYVEIAGSRGADRGSVILTDVMPSELDRDSLERISTRTVFLSPVPACSDASGRLHIIFKYSDITAILSELSAVYSEWTGDRGSFNPSTRVIAVISESDQICPERCRTLAAQIIYVHGGSVLVIPLGYINDHQTAAPDAEGCFRRLMYMIDEGKDYSPDTFTVTDSYGISYLRLPPGVNPVTELDSEYLGRLINSAGSHFDTVILDVGTCFRKENISIISSASEIVFFGSGRRIGELAGYIGDEQDARTRKITALKAADEAIALDDFVREIYGETG